MKLSAKPISSPSRAEKFPPPLLRFLRSNGGSKSRGKSSSSYRSSPIFIRKKIVDTQIPEPSSPKVTCMGQVRVRRSNQQTVSKKKKRSSGYQWIQKTMFCCHLDQKLTNPKTSKTLWGSGVSLFCRKKKESMRIEAKPVEIEEIVQEKAEILIGSTPPRNALMLMRCRSEPYRASSLANRFWGREETNQEENPNPTLEMEPICRDSAPESRTDPETEEKLSFCEGLESSSSTSSTKSCSKIEAETSKVVLPGRPLLLTRCKSEPAGRSEKFEVETCFWKGRLAFVDISTTRF